jgi:hypothetical protein
MKFILNDRIIIKIPIKLTKKLKISNLPHKIEVKVKYNKINIPNIINMIFPKDRFDFLRNTNFIIISYAIILYYTSSGMEMAHNVPAVYDVLARP